MRRRHRWRRPHRPSGARCLASRAAQRALALADAAGRWQRSPRRRRVAGHCAAGQQYVPRCAAVDDAHGRRPCRAHRAGPAPGRCRPCRAAIGSAPAAARWRTCFQQNSQQRHHRRRLAGTGANQQNPGIVPSLAFAPRPADIDLALAAGAARVPRRRPGCAPAVRLRALSWGRLPWLASGLLTPCGPPVPTPLWWAASAWLHPAAAGTAVQFLAYLCHAAAGWPGWQGICFWLWPADCCCGSAGAPGWPD